MHYAVEDGDLRIVKLLISKGAHIHAKDKDGRTPLQLAKELKIKDSSHVRREIAILLTNVHDENKKQIHHLIKKVNELSLTNDNNQKLTPVAQEIKEDFSIESDVCLSESKIFNGEYMKSNVIQDGDLNNKSLEFEDSKLAFDEEQQGINVFNEALPQLVKFQEFYRKYSKSATKTPTEKRLIDNYKEFITKHPDINLGRSDVANLKTICAHGTNAWTVFSAFALTNLQLLPKFAMKVRGIPIGAGELISEKEKAKFYRYTSYPNTISQNYVSTVWLGSKDSALAEVFNYARMSVESYKYNYNEFKEKLLKEKCSDLMHSVSKSDPGNEFTIFSSRRCSCNKSEEKLLKKWGNKSVIQELKEVLESDSMSEIYEGLSSIPVVIIGDGIGGVGVDSSISGETGYERVNIRIVVTFKEHQIFIQELIKKINPKKFKDVALLTIEELFAFEDNRPKKGKPMCYKGVGGPGGRLIPLGVHENTFVHDFLNTFGDKLPFSTSDKFDRIPIERTTLIKKEIKGELSNDSASKVGYYKANSDINVMYDDEDSSYLNTEVVSNLHPINKQECDEIEDIQQLEIRPLITENFYSIEDLNFKPTSHKANPMKKAAYGAMIASPFIAMGIYAAVALSAGIVEFNPIIAAGIFVEVTVAAIACFAIMKAYGKVNEEKGKNSSVSSYVTFENELIPEYVKSDEAAIS
ncbi:MAG: hypothetical protein sL5_07890 [Candidatus Mesenet longicola]|uniref:Ankyrin repeat domain-containing protein n=1 Tax=Candidatus Mesenet longicola TaxID=1892558 RepID=A0A8J3HQ53_9RICK|nr:MAG: hypothetical protein sGL2_08570 [Candidatus Mesenet longicola]GHM59796.1 MAG: hypothetical protein sL5_07890 [Candidatus Mesenet longicola]